MCGIIGIIGEEEFTAKDLLAHLARLEYRGYDSFGYATPTTIRKGVGRIAIQDDDARVHMRKGIAHTRWATHGKVTHENAHPHKVGRVTLVHNGIIENYKALQDAHPGIYASETDSERLAAHIDASLDGEDPLPAVLHALSSCDGTWAIACMIDGHDGLFAARKDAPLILGRTEGKLMVSSDVRGIPDAEMVHPLDDGGAVHLTCDGVRMVDAEGVPKEVAWEPNTLRAESARPEGHAMEHEILETPEALLRLSRTGLARITPGTIIGCGSSINAAMIGASIADVDVRTVLASEYDPARDGSPRLIALSQSGETADILDAVKRAKAHGKHVTALVNTPHSTLTRLADETFLLHAGEERCVAATKSCTLQAAAVSVLLGRDVFRDAITGTRRAIAEREAIKVVAQRISAHHDVFIISRTSHFGLAHELALKLKEIAYQHAEAIPALELKHGPLALVEDGTPVLALGDAQDSRMMNSTHEVEARGGTMIPWYLGTSPAEVFAALVAGQLLTYEVALLRGTPIDHPRNLAKSVTVF